MVSLYPTVPITKNSKLQNFFKNVHNISDNYINRKTTNFSSALFAALGLFGKYAPNPYILGSCYKISFALGGVTFLPFLINRINKKYDDKTNIINRAQDWSKNVGQHNLSKISAVGTFILGFIALYFSIDPIIWQALFTASVILSLTTLLLAEIIDKQYKEIISDKNSKGINNFEISMTKHLGLYFGEAKI